jgi:hypothetical protein
MVNGGYYDLATPFFAAQYEEKHLPIPQSLAKNIEYDWYESGHMVYVRDESLKQLHDRVAAFIKSTFVTSISVVSTSSPSVVITSSSIWAQRRPATCLKTHWSGQGCGTVSW